MAVQPKWRNPNWQLTIQVSGQPNFLSRYGPMAVNKIVYSQWETKANITLFGSGAGPMQPRSVMLKMGGYSQSDEIPEWVLQVIREANFARAEV